MKPSNIAPAYACLYPGLCEVARKLGYALAIHGSVVNDLDLIACPWVEEVAPVEELVTALMNHIGACSYPELLRRAGVPEEHIADIVARKNKGKDPEAKPHGRKAWNLYLDHGCRVDLSVMPKGEPDLATMLPIEDHACSTGDCPHEKQVECDETLKRDYPGMTAGKAMHIAHIKNR